MKFQREIKVNLAKCIKCQGLCCKFFIVRYHKKLVEKLITKNISDWKRFLSYHNIKLIEFRGEYLLRFPIKCSKLNYEGIMPTACRSLELDKDILKNKFNECIKESA